MKKIRQLIDRIGNTPANTSVRSGLIMLIPVLMIGSAALVFLYFPVAGYQTFVEAALNGRLSEFFNFIYNATFGMFSVYLTCSISFCYSKTFSIPDSSLACPVTSLICFSILSGVRISNATWDALGVKGVFIAIISALSATKLLMLAVKLFRRRRHQYTEDTDIEFNSAVSVIFPAASVVAVFALFNIAVTTLFGVESVFQLFVDGANSVFYPLGRSFLSGLLMVLASSLLWFFGIHGSNVLESVMDNLFTPAIDVNIALIEAGNVPTEIITKQFFDNFVLMGGCGTAICLLLSLLIFSKRRRNRQLSRLAAVPMLFNINELMTFGFPVIYNTTLFIPFVLTPAVSYITTYLAMKSGLVPLTSSVVNWTAPVLLSGYMATGSVMGSALQLFNIIIGVFIYCPFIKAYDRKSEEASLKLISGLVDIKKRSEASTLPVTLTALTDRYGSVARSVVSDLKYALSTDDLQIFYQPQYDSRRVCVGAEALLRWKHPLYGMMYPPLVIQLAEEGGILTELEKYILSRVAEDSGTVRALTGYEGEISVNVTALTVQSDEYFALLKRLVTDGDVFRGDICLEITEQNALPDDNEASERLSLIKSLGYTLAIDDFSMGHTSLAYLQENHFDTVKLDGQLVTDMVGNTRSYDIVKNITALAKKLGFSVIAEFVETEAQVKMLEAADCYEFQGYLFGKGVTLDEFIERLRKEAPATVHGKK